MTRKGETSGGFRNLLSVHGLIDDAPLLAEAIVDTVREPLLLLDPDLKVVLANRSFYLTFHVEPAETLDWMVYELGNGQWNIPRLRELLEEILPANHSFTDFEVTHNFPHIGRKVMLLNATKLRRREGQNDLILLAIEDDTVVHDQQEELKRLVREREVLVQEVHHRVKNNLQTIVSLLNLQSRYTDSVHVADALAEAGERVQAIARLHERLYASSNFGEVDVDDYLRNLANDLQHLHSRPGITFEVASDDIVLDMEMASPLALIANELILNSLKHAFPAGQAGQVAVSFEYVRDSVPDGEPLDNGLVSLRVEDNGVGVPSGQTLEELRSMGLELVRLLCQQLRATCDFHTGNGVQWTITFPLRRVS